MKKTIVVNIINIMLAVTSFVFLWISPFYLWIKIVGSVASAVLFALILAFSLLKNKYLSLTLMLNFLLTGLIIMLAILYFTGLIEHFRDIDSAREWFDSFGVVAWLIFFIVQILQVVALPIPAQITTIAGVLIFGSLQCFVISALAIILGSIICFGIGKWVGVKVAYKIADKDTVDKYRKLISKRGTILLPIAFLFPLFPDDLLCFLAGATTMSFKSFFIITLLTRTVGVACICWLGSGDIIPFSGWGVPVWIALIICVVIITAILFKNQDKVEEVIVNKITKNNKDDKNKLYAQQSVAFGKKQNDKKVVVENKSQNIKKKEANIKETLKV